MLLVLVVLGAFALYVMNRNERARLLQAMLAAGDRFKTLLNPARVRRGSLPPAGPSRALSFVAPLLVVLNVIVFAAMLLRANAPSDSATLVAWGASFGPRTTNGEWWRLVTALFLHAGVLELLADIIGLLFVGIILEEMLGALALGTAYLGAGVAAGVVTLSARPASVTFGASGAIWGLYGVLLGALAWGLFDRTLVRIPVVALRRVAIATAVFILYNLASPNVDRTANITGLVSGLLYGLGTARGAAGARPPLRRIAGALAATAAVAIACAVPLRGFTDVRPEIERVVTLEERTAGAYEAAVNRFRQGHITADALARVIDQSIIPELRAAAEHLDTLEHVPQEQQWAVADVKQYLRLRADSWKLRASALYKHNMRALRQAEEAERASLATLEKVRNADLM